MLAGLKGFATLVITFTRLFKTGPSGLQHPIKMEYTVYQIHENLLEFIGFADSYQEAFELATIRLGLLAEQVYIC